MERTPAGRDSVNLVSRVQKVTRARIGTPEWIGGVSGGAIDREAGREHVSLESEMTPL